MKLNNILTNQRLNLTSCLWPRRETMFITSSSFQIRLKFKIPFRLFINYIMPLPIALHFKRFPHQHMHFKFQKLVLKFSTARWRHDRHRFIGQDYVCLLSLPSHTLILCTVCNTNSLLVVRWNWKHLIQNT